MAKRKRLSPAALMGDTEMPPDLETKARDGCVGVRPRIPRAPIAEVSGDAATRAAFEEVASEFSAARAEGRMVVKLPLSSIDAGHLVRDRLALDEDEMAVLKDSLRDRGQQTPIEVVELGEGHHGLISGWRRLTALQALFEETGHDAFASVQALIRTPQDAAAAYRAMVEENEIRSDLSFYERARIAVQAVGQGIHPDTKTAVQSLFSAARAPKRSKIVAFATLVGELDDHLRFPASIPERLGLALVAALQNDAGFAARLKKALRSADPDKAAAERAVLERALRKRRKTPPLPPADIVPGVRLESREGRATLSGKGVDSKLLADLRDWLVRRNS